MASHAEFIFQQQKDKLWVHHGSPKGRYALAMYNSSIGNLILECAKGLPAMGFQLWCGELSLRTRAKFMQEENIIIHEELKEQSCGL